MRNLLFVLLIGLMTTGCASSYMVDRGRDAADIFTVSIGRGAGAKARVGLIATGLVYSQSLAGIEGGQLYGPLKESSSLERCNADLAVLLGGIETVGKHTYSTSRAKSCDSFYFCFFPVEHLSDASNNSSAAALYSSVNVVIGAGVTVKAGISFGELLDFILGWATIDILNDDIESKKSKKELKATDKPAP